MWVAKCLKCLARIHAGGVRGELFCYAVPVIAGNFKFALGGGGGAPLTTGMREDEGGRRLPQGGREGGWECCSASDVFPECRASF